MLPALIIAAVLLSQDIASQEAQQPRPIGSRTQTDQTVNVQKGMRVDLRDCAGDVIVKTWDRDAVRVRAHHSSRTKVHVTPRDQVLQIRQDGFSGVDVDLTVPTWINLHLEGTHCFIDVEGLAGNLNANTTEGDVEVRGLTGTAVIEAIEGTVKIQGGRGRVQVTTSDGDIEVTKAGGELVLESIDGSIQLTDVSATAIEVSTVDGDVTYTGAFQASGRYRFETHDGSVSLVIPENTSATFTIRRYDGSRRIDSTLPLKPVGDVQRGRRMTYTLGGGSAQVDIESFDGSIQIRRPGEIKKD